MAEIAADPQQRILRLENAIGDGPHAFGLDLHQHLRAVLEMIGDLEALKLHQQTRYSREGD